MRPKLSIGARLTLVQHLEDILTEPTTDELLALLDEECPEDERTRLRRIAEHFADRLLGGPVHDPQDRCDGCNSEDDRSVPFVTCELRHADGTLLEAKTFFGSDCARAWLDAISAKVN